MKDRYEVVSKELDKGSDNEVLFYQIFDNVNGHIIDFEFLHPTVGILPSSGSTIKEFVELSCKRLNNEFNKLMR